MTVQEMARRAREAQPVLGNAPAAQRNQALQEIARAVEASSEAILAANQADVEAASQHLSGPMVARLRLDARKLKGIVDGVRAVATLPEVLGEEIAAWERPNGLRIRKVRVPLGVIGMIFESRPGVAVDASVLCLKTGNAVLLKGGKEAVRSVEALGQAIAAGLERAGLPRDLVQVLPANREAAAELMAAVGLVDVLIPRGGAGLIRAVLEQSRVPVIETGTGVCHTYVHRDADLAMARRIVLNAKLSNPSVCNAMETLLVDRAISESFLPQVAEDLKEAGVTLRCCSASRKLIPWAEAATEEDWATEYNDLILSIRVVDGLDEAMAHIRRYGTRHSEAIVTQNEAAAARFLAEVDASTVYHNASTRFTDGGEFGFGAEIGISTQKLHARGPMGLPELTSYKYIVLGQGQVRE